MRCRKTSDVELVQMPQRMCQLLVQVQTKDGHARAATMVEYLRAAVSAVPGGREES